jgi:hypothetical protein
MKKYLLFILYNLFSSSIFSQNLEFNRPQITFLYTNSSKNNVEIEKYIDFISSHNFNANLVEIANGVNIIQNKSNLEERDYLRYNDFYEGSPPFFNQVEFNQVSNPKVNFSIEELNANKKKLLLKTVNDIFKFIFNVGKGDNLNLDRFFIRAVLNAKQSDIKLSENVARGKNIITDNILKLTNQIYIALIDYDKWKLDGVGYINTKSKVAVYRIDFNKVLNNSNFWKNKFSNKINDDLLTEEDFDVFYLKSTSLKSVTKDIGESNNLYKTLYYQDLEQFFNNLN